MDSHPAPVVKENETPNLYLLGAVYGLLWGCVALGILAILTIAVGSVAPYYLLGSIPTGILMTKLLGKPLGRAKGWMLAPFGLMALLLGTLIFAFCMLIVFSGVNFVQNLKHQDIIQSFVNIRTHDLLIMFIWYPFYGFAMIFPIFLAVWNCWDLRQRMNRPAAA